jgi:hypothetical protein
MSHMRIESHEKVVRDARVFFVDGDEEIDISSCIQVVDVHLGIGELATATLKTIIGQASVTAQIEDIVVRHVKKPKPIWRRLLRRRPREITTINDRTRRWA